MKKAIKAFLTITALLVGLYLVYDGTGSGYHKNEQETLVGLLLIAIGLTAIWVRYSKSKISN